MIGLNILTDDTIRTSSDDLTVKESLPADEFENTDVPVQLENLLRKKTFNSELRLLVDRIRENENIKTSSGHDSQPDGTAAGTTDDKLLKKLHGLFYRVKNLDGVTANYLPMPDSIQDDEFFLSIGDPAGLVRDIVQSSGFLSYQILIFRKSERAFVTFLPGDDTLNSSSIGFHDPVFSLILNSPSGIILKSDEISADPYSAKRFPGMSGKSGEYLYINSFHRIIHGQENFKNENFIQRALSPLLLLTGSLSGHDISPELIFRKTHKNLSLSLNALGQTLEHTGTSPIITSYYDMTEWLEFLLYLHRIRGDIKGLIIRLRNSSSTEDLIMMRYLFTRIGKEIPDDSAMVRYSRDVLIIFLQTDAIPSVENIVQEYENLFEGDFRLELINPEVETFVSLINRLQA